MKKMLLVICAGCVFVLAGCGSENESDQAFESRINRMVEAAEKADNKEEAYKEIQEALNERYEQSGREEVESHMKKEGRLPVEQRDKLFKQSMTKKFSGKE